MKTDQIYRQLKSDPDNVELARQIWNELARTEVVKGLSELDITAPSIENWKSVLRFVHANSEDVRPLLLSVFKPLLNHWPTGMRPLPISEAPTSDYSTSAFLNSGAAQLCDTIVQRLPRKDYNKLLSQPNLQLRHFKMFMFCARPESTQLPYCHPPMHGLSKLASAPKLDQFENAKESFAITGEYYLGASVNVSVNSPMAVFKSVDRSRVAEKRDSQLDSGRAHLEHIRNIDSILSETNSNRVCVFQ